MTTINIECQTCGSTIELTKALAAPLLDNQRKEFVDKFSKQETAQREREEALSRREADLAKQDQEIEKRVAQQLESKLTNERKEFEKKFKLEINSLNDRLEEKYGEINKAQQKELEMRKARDEALQERDRANLEVERKVDQRLAEARDNATEVATEKANKKIAEQDQILQTLRTQISDMERKADPTAAHIHGDIQEQNIVGKLQMEFPQDSFDRVTKGARGADIIQRVMQSNGRIAGSILVEVKNTQNWDNNWLVKLKDDQRVAGADIPVIVSRAMPRGVTTFANVDNVWVCAESALLPMISCLRSGVLGVAREKASVMVSIDRKEQIFQYLKSNSFSMRIQSILESYEAMRTELDREKKTQYNYWAKRERSLNRMIEGISGLSGDFQQLGGPGVLEENSDNQLEFTSQDSVATESFQPLGHSESPTNKPTLRTPEKTPEADMSPSDDTVFTAPPNEAPSTIKSPVINFTPIPSGTNYGTSDLHIVEILVRVGQPVSVGTPLVGVSDRSGKAEILKASVKGRIQSINLSKGDTLTEEEILQSIRIESFYR